MEPTNKPTRAAESALAPIEKPAVPFYLQQETSSKYRFYLSTEIDEPENYHQMCQILRTVPEGDTVFIHLNSPGGRLDATSQIIAAMRECRGDVITVADGIVASAATLIFLAGDGFIVNPQCLFMIHNWSGGAYGKGHELEAQIGADIRWFKKLAQDFYEVFLSEDEFNKMLRGEDYWFTADEVSQRIGRRVAHLQKRNVAAKMAAAQSRFDSIRNEVDPYIDERQAKQLERIFKCVVGGMSDPKDEE
jgi:ATP-dependent protease ClpP protease subunit